MTPVADRLSKTGSALMKLVAEDEADRIQEVVDELTARFDSVKNVLRQRANKLDDALQHMSEVIALLSVFVSVYVCMCLRVFVSCIVYSNIVLHFFTLFEHPVRAPGL